MSVKCKFRKKIWEVIWREMPDANGLTDYEDRLLFFNPRIQDRREMATFLHEVLHACFRDMTEAAIEEVATDVARFLYDHMGYRRPPTAERRRPDAQGDETDPVSGQRQDPGGLRREEGPGEGAGLQNKDGTACPFRGQPGYAAD